MVAYDGGEFRGWAAQPGQRTVLSTLKNAVRQVSGEKNEITGASRTDSGAHARHQVAHFDTANPMPPERWSRVLNDLLPMDVSILRSTKVPDDFHSRFSAVDRLYRYRIRFGPRQPLHSRYVFDTHYQLDAAKMHEAAQSLVGSHDFFAFSEEVPVTANPIREVYQIDVRQTGRETWIEIRANAFMRGMMRRISGGLYEVGSGRRDPAEIGLLLDPQQRSDFARPVVLPARGLCLMKIRYGRHPADFRNSTANELNDDE